MLRHVTLPDGAFPSGMDPQNAIRSFYKTNLLYPAPGPVTATAYIFRFTRIARHLAIAAKVVGRLRDYRGRYHEVPKIAKRTKTLDPQSRNPNGYIEHFISGIREHTLLGPGGNLAPELRTMTTGAAGTVRSTARVALSRFDAGAARAALHTDEQKVLDTAVLLQALSVPNVVFGDLYDAKLLSGEGAIIAQPLLGDEPPHEAILSAVVQGNVAADERTLKAAAPLVQMALRRVARTRSAELLTSFEGSPRVRNLMISYFVHRLGVLSDIPHPFFPHPGGFYVKGDETESPQQEWAFQRSEELRLALETPILRGPIGATPVSPRSRHTRTETETTSTTEVNVTSTARQVRSAESHQVISASTFSSALEGLTESGIADASAFEQQHTLLSTLSEERRAVIDTVAREISSGVESGRTTTSVHSLGRSTVYRTSGKDPKLASTELGYQVVVPVNAETRLREIGLAWCPRVPLPFAPLRENVRKHEVEQRDAYETQYYVPLPVGPALKSEVIKEEYFEIWLRGRNNVNKKDFKRLIPMYDENTFIELDEITVKHRNGGWDDAQEIPGYGDIPYNYDDLEDARPYLENLRLSADGQTLRGTGVLETHDPEYLNVSWLGITVPIRGYTDETVAAVAAFEQAKLDRESKLQAVQSRAWQYARMKRDELIEQYERTIDLRQEAFRGLIRRICLDVPPAQLSYFEEVLSRCINWNEASMSLESEEMTNLSYRDLAPDHFMNAPGARFFLPIQKGAEGLFFSTLERTGHDYYAASVATIRSQLGAYRAQIAGWITNNAPELVLDTYRTEIVIGSHLEAVLSQSEFAT